MVRTARRRRPRRNRSWSPYLQHRPPELRKIREIGQRDETVVQANKDDLDTCPTAPCFTFGGGELKFSREYHSEPYRPERWLSGTSVRGQYRRISLSKVNRALSQLVRRRCSIPTYETALGSTLDGSLSDPSNEDKSAVFSYSGVGKGSTSPPPRASSRIEQFFSG